MDNSGDEEEEKEEEEDDTEWKSSFADTAAVGPAAASGSFISATTHPHRVILHFDLDCFYAQVEMIRNPALRQVPLGIQQKYIIVTCNYVARERGVTKLMSVTDALEKCPELVLVRGEDLTHYRDMSYKVTELLLSYSPLVERLGFDENFMDVTEMVERRLGQTAESSSLSFTGHVYSRIAADVEAIDHQRLALGSHIAAELREAIHSKLGLTGCAGIANNKLLAKLVSGTHKPNQQTALLPENISDIMDSLSGLRKVPGVGHQTAKRLQALGLVAVKDLQLCSLRDLVREFGSATAQRLKNLALGVDESPVTPTGAPQSLSDEDSFKKMSSPKEVQEKIQQLLTSLVERMHKDGRQPQTFRLTIRKYSVANKWFNRESRQCPILNHIGQKITSGCAAEAVDQLIPVAMKLFQKMVDVGAAFHLTLINVCFSNLQSRTAAVSGKGSITSFFTHSTSPRKTQSALPQSQGSSSHGGSRHFTDHRFGPPSADGQHKKKLTTKSSCSPEAPLHGLKWEEKLVDGEEETLEASCSSTCDFDDTNGPALHQLPPNVDPEVFKLLPEEIQKELLSPAYVNSLPSHFTAKSVSDVEHGCRNRAPQTVTLSASFKDVKKAPSQLHPADRGTTVNHRFPAGMSVAPGEHDSVEGTLPSSRSSDCECPGNVDPGVFSELPPDVQRELMSEWKQQKLILKTPQSKKPVRSSMSRDKKSAGRGSQANSLFKYFKPS
ncbi:DNA polymerase iota [Salarias fasciatus]|uniref:UmuC domain-containing protein n=1 Tax=Salarias fasciatus TaxID=181472 RepID=A0A672HAQ7_SALFA|nr:DNA polymerase iota [Salarias fasciatus]